MSQTALQTQQQTAMKQVSHTLQQFKDKLQSALPSNSNIEQFVSSVLATVAGSLALQKCSPNSIALAAYDAATLGLPVNKLGLAWLVPYGNEAKFQIGYRGYIQLVMETGFVQDVTAEVVRENDKFSYVLGTKPQIYHEPAKSNRGAITHVYALAFLANGIVKQCIMSREQVEHIKAKSRSAGNGPWVTDYDEMAKKTVIKRLCKLLPYNVKGLERVDRASEIEDEREQLQHYQAQLPAYEQPQLASAPTVEFSELATDEPTIEPLVETVTPEGRPVAPVNSNPLISELLDLQAQLESIDSKCDRLPKGFEAFQDSQLKRWIEKKHFAIKEAKEKAN